MGYAVGQSATDEPLLFLLVASSDHITPHTGATPTVVIRKNGGAFITPAGAVSEVGQGWYKVAPSASDRDTLGPLLLHATAVGADPVDELFDVGPDGLRSLRRHNASEDVPFFLVDNVTHILGVTGAVPTVTISKAGAAFTVPAGAVAEIAFGWYRILPNATDAASVGPFIVHATHVNADPCDEQYDVIESSIAAPDALTSTINVRAYDIIVRALKLLMVLGEGQTPSAEQLADGLERLNDLCDSYGAERLMMRQVRRGLYPLTAGDAEYSFGAGGDFNQALPLAIDYAGLLVNGHEYPVDVLSDQEWQHTRQKGLTSNWPRAVYMDREHPLSTLSVYPVPTDAGLILVLYTATAVTQFADLYTPYTFPNGWSRMFRYTLAVDWAEEFGKTPTERVERIARESKAIVQSVNVQPAELGMPPGLGGRGRGWDVRAGDWV